MDDEGANEPNVALVQLLDTTIHTYKRSSPMTNEEKKNLCLEFQKVWPITRLKSMTLIEYTEAGSKESFTYWIKARLGDLGSIWGGSAFKFGIYNRVSEDDSENGRGRMYDESYGWLLKYGETASIAFKNVKKSF